MGLKLLQLDGDTVARLKREDPKFPPVQQGLLVPAVTPGSPAHHAGMQAGDVITGTGPSSCHDTARLLEQLLVWVHQSCPSPQLLLPQRAGCPARFRHVSLVIQVDARAGMASWLLLRIMPIMSSLLTQADMHGTTANGWAFARLARSLRAISSQGIANDSIKRNFPCDLEHVQRALIKDLGAGWEGAIHHGRQEFSTEQLVQCFADNIGRPVSLSVRRGTKQTLRLKVVPQRAC